MATCPGSGSCLGGGGAPCDHEIELFDSFGDGWDGATVDVLVNGGLVLDDITDFGGGTLFTFSAATGDTITTVYTSGPLESDNSYEIRDGNGLVIGFDGPFPGPGIDATAACPDGGGDCFNAGKARKVAR